MTRAIADIQQRLDGLVTWTHHAEVTSTNDLAMQLARESAPSGMLLTADFQTAGRGRRGATWVAPPESSVLFSLLWRPTRRLAPHELTILTGVAGVLGLHEVGGYAEIKWPNDLMLCDRKVGGILIETTSDAVVIGMGINCSTPAEAFPADLRARAGSLASLLDEDIAREDVLVAVVEKLCTALREVETDGLARYLADWNLWNWLSFRPVRVSGPLGSLEGTGMYLHEEHYLQTQQVLVCVKQEQEDQFMPLPVSVEVR